MRGRLQSAFAVVAGLLLLTTAALGGAFMQPGVDSVDDATGQYVERADGQVALGVGLAVGAAAYYAYDNYIKNEPSASPEELAKTDALETKKEIYDQASIQSENSELTSTAYSNYLQDTESIALMEGKNAYIRALENGSTESVARNRATEAVADYYSVKQKNLIASWNTSVYFAKSAQFTAKNTTGVSERYVNGEMDRDATDGYTSWGNITAFAPSNETYTLVNSSEVVVPDVTVKTGNGETWNASFNSTQKNPPNPTGWTGAPGALMVNPPNSNYDKLTFLNVSELRHNWRDIEAQNDDVQASLDTFIDNTYSSYQQGEINTSDLVDPYLGAREYSPETSNTWTLRTLSAMGMDSPQNLSNIGRMNVTASGDTYTGVLMSDGTPSGGYVVGNSYNASNITGAQFVATDDGGAVKLEGNFTLDSAEGYAAGETVEYTNISYQTANTTEFKELQSQLDQLTAEINARQQKQRSAGGGGILPDFGAGGAIPGAILLAAAAAFLMTRD